LENFKRSIFSRLIEKGGVYGLSAKNFAEHQIFSSQVIVECFEQCHHQNAIDFWVKELVKDIIEFRFFLLNEKRTELREILNHLNPLPQTIKFF